MKHLKLLLQHAIELVHLLGAKLLCMALIAFIVSTANAQSRNDFSLLPNTKTATNEAIKGDIINSFELKMIFFICLIGIIIITLQIPSIKKWLKGNFYK